jgi:uncharacterized membrane protein
MSFTGQNKARQHPNVGYIERWASAIGGGALASVGLRRGYLKKPAGIALMLVAGHHLYRGITGHDRIYEAIGVDTSQIGPRFGVSGDAGFKVEKSVTVNRSPDQLYRFWHNFENLPHFMDHLESVQSQGAKRSHWVVKAPAGTTVAWDAEITDDRPNELISWRSLPNADVDNEGTVRFVPAPGGRGTEVHVSLAYNPPAGVVGSAVAKLFGEEPNQQVASDLRRFKNIMEAGEIPTTAGQPSGERSLLGKVASPQS